MAKKSGSGNKKGGDSSKGEKKGTDSGEKDTKVRIL